ncbi:hypothetical protein GOV11_02515 [Candidatus Woesearchaeota archaeon]|nr:hypothetical protein [Candidatus Woesearchaeota archaeon]
MAIEDLVKLVKSKKELENLDDQYVQEKLERYFEAHPKILEKLAASKTIEQFTRSKVYKEMLKHLRKSLRTVYGVFQKGDRYGLLNMIAKESDLDRQKMLVGELLQTHTSTKERLADYYIIYKELSERLPAPNIVIDLGCGLNPLSHQYMERHGWSPKWIATDISTADMEFLQTCFDTLDIPGKTLRLDLTKDYEKIKNLKGDVTFLFKLLDSLEEVERHISYKIFDNITTPYIVTSFPTRSLGGKKTIAKASRTWFERLLKRKNLKWETFNTENELFYVIKT